MKYRYKDTNVIVETNRVLTSPDYVLAENGEVAPVQLEENAADEEPVKADDTEAEQEPVKATRKKAATGK